MSQSPTTATPTPPAAPQPAPAPSPVLAAAPRPMSAVPVFELPPLRPLPTADPYSPVATGQALFCSVFNLAFSALTAWLAAIPQHLIAQVRQSFTSHASPDSHSSHLSHPSHPSHSSSVPQSPCPPVAKSSLAPSPRSALHPPRFSERILLACRSLYSLLRVYHTFSSYWERVTPRQLGLLSRAAVSIKAFSGQSFDFSFWADLGRRPARVYTPSSSVAQSPALPLTPSSSVAESPSPQVPQSSSSSPSPRSALSSPPFPEWPFTALTAYNASFTTAPGRLLAQVCHDLGRLTQSPSPSPSEFESPSPSCSQSDVALSSQSQSRPQSQSTPSTPSIESIGSIQYTPSTPSSSTLDNGPLALDIPHSPNPPP